jgi:hypothetical protein
MVQVDIGRLHCIPILGNHPIAPCDLHSGPLIADSSRHLPLTNIDVLLSLVLAVRDCRSLR